MKLKSLKGHNKARLALVLYIRACRCFYLWRMRSTQCNDLTVNSRHLKFQSLNIQSAYFKFLKRQEVYRKEPLEAFDTPRLVETKMIHEQVKLSSLKILSKLIKAKKIFWEWRTRAYKRKTMSKLGRLFWRKKCLIKLLRYLYDISRIKKVNNYLETKCNSITLYKKVFIGLKQHLSKRKNIKHIIHSRSQQKLTRFKFN